MIVRALSALAAVALIAAVAVYLPGIGLYALCSVVVFGCIYEYSKLTLRPAKAPLQFQISFMIFAAFVYIVTIFSPAGSTISGFAAESGPLGVEIGSSSGLVGGIGALALMAMSVIGVRRTSDLPQAYRIQSAALLGLFYVGYFPGYAIALLGDDNGLSVFFGLLAIVFAGDTCAYLAGRFFGRHKLLESVSPKKTIEGSIGGLVGSAIVGFVLAKFYLVSLPMDQVVTIAVVSGGFAQIGDLFESLIKRIADVKDSGRIMPGHGGFLDRLDGVLFAAPIYYVLLKLIS